MKTPLRNRVNAFTHFWPNRRLVVPPLAVHSLLGLALTLCVQGAAPVVSFDWSMPDRFGLDRNGDGLIDYSYAVTFGYD